MPSARKEDYARKPKEAFVLLKERHENDLYNKKSVATGNAKKNKKWISEMKQILENNIRREEARKWGMLLFSGVILIAIMSYMS